MIWKKSLITALSVFAVVLFIGASMTSAVATSNDVSSAEKECPFCGPNQSAVDGDDEPPCEDCLTAAVKIGGHVLTRIAGDYSRWHVWYFLNMGIDFGVYFKEALSIYKINFGEANLKDEINAKINEAAGKIKTTYLSLLEIVRAALRVGEGNHLDGELTAQIISIITAVSIQFGRLILAPIQGFVSYLKKLCNLYNNEDDNLSDDSPLKDIESESIEKEVVNFEKKNIATSAVSKSAEVKGTSLKSSTKKVKSENVVSSTSTKIVKSKPVTTSKTSSSSITTSVKPKISSASVSKSSASTSSPKAVSSAPVMSSAIRTSIRTLSR